jgi:LPXTG-site transpeptidase (sortase) family protein
VATELPAGGGDTPHAAAPARRGPRLRHAVRGRTTRLLLLTVGVGLIVAGVLVIAIPLAAVWRRGQADTEALKAWNSGGSQALIGAAPDSGSHPSTATCHAASAPASDYALVSFPSLPQYGYAQVAGNGTWDLLTQRSMVHYQTSAAPGHQGNVIIAFHREAEFEHIDELKPGGTVDVQDRTCKVWHYTVTQRWTLYPDQVTQLDATTGNELTLITCTPWYVDSQRIVWRAELAPGQ